MPKIARRVAQFGTNVFTEINVLATKHKSINLGQGKPEFDGPAPIMAAFVDTLQSGQHNQYAPVPGSVNLRRAVANHANVSYGLDVDAENGVLVTPGATNALFSTTTGLVDPGDEVIVIEPFFDTYVPNILMLGAKPVFVPLHPPKWTFDSDELRAAFNPKTRAIILNTPHNPTGRVFTLAELMMIAELCKEFDVTVISDEVYEHLLFDDAKHIPIASLPGMFERTVTIGSAGKTFGMTGWKIGWVYGPQELINGVIGAHQFMTFAVNHPAQEAVAHGFTLKEELAAYYARYAVKRDLMIQGLEAGGLNISIPEGTYFVTADFSDIFDGDDIEFARYLTAEIGVSCIPPTAFFSAEHKHIASKYARFAFCKHDETLHQAAERLATLEKR
jgi:N-succinyldiaminopimelate aminotransferase